VTGATGPTGTNGTNGSNGEKGATGAAGSNGSSTGTTGGTGATGPAGSNGANGSNGSGGGGGKETCITNGVSPNDVTNCFLKPKFAETGTWSASISAPAGAPQQEADGVVSFNPKYGFEINGFPGVTLHLKDKNEVESQTPAAPCVGTPLEPQASKGFLCVYRASTVAKEAGEKSIQQPTVNITQTFATPNGEFIAQGGECNKENGQCQQGVLLVFRTTGFAEAGTGLIPAGGSYLNAKGDWAVTSE
jgi:hypothetical protein